MNNENLQPAITTSSTITNNTYLLPSVKLPLTKSYTYASPVPILLAENRPDKINEPCVLGVDEAGRGPCLGSDIENICLIDYSSLIFFRTDGLCCLLLPTLSSPGT